MLAAQANATSELPCRTSNWIVIPIQRSQHPCKEDTVKKTRLTAAAAAALVAVLATAVTVALAGRTGDSAH